MPNQNAMPVVGLGVMLTLVLLVCQLFGMQWLAWDRGLILSGEYWRLYSGHFVHLGFKHLALNVLAMWILAVLFATELNGRRWLVLLLVLPTMISAGLWWGLPHLQGYVGLSAVLHGVFVVGAVQMLLDRAERIFGLVLLSGLLVKLWLEPGGADTGITATFIGGHVLVQSHQWGALAGLMVAAVELLQQGVAYRKKPI